ncbi:Alpha-1,2-mannosidase [Alloactinosynnema sp. L-07]|uniref:GH92 family glycosyl hydrolase n=1 Tax=Alloactinosynnema sp. L-07 TaxID=1653480 RepID=UPI00065EF554|nr:GH92 family glycosyl hydrolase [Alloactinosynnema sp. L-07]CRK57109.1 Alpha-1,2-mannosidase [Alloactinosynnema sp. L-07]
MIADGFRTSFESDDPVPTWTDAVEVGDAGIPLADGVSLRTRVGGGPADAPSARSGVGFTGSSALRYEGEHTAAGLAFRTNRIFWTELTVEADTELSYVIYPELTGGDLRYPSTYAAIDLVFTDGTYLSELGAVDQLGFPLTPLGQGESRALLPDQWNHRVVRLGEVALGKSVSRILLAYRSPHGPAQFAGWVDDVVIASVRRPARAPVDRVITTRGTHSSGAYSRGNTFPATAVPHGFNFWTPVTNAAVTNWFYEFHRGSTPANRPALEAIGISHQPSPWMGDRHTFHLMPTQGTSVGHTARALTFSHDNETAQPHYYAVDFDSGVRVEIAPTDHAAVLRFTFPPGAANLVLDNVGAGAVRVGGDGTITGYSDVRSGLSAGAGRMYVHATVDQPLAGAQRRLRGLSLTRTALLRFQPGQDGTVVTVRIATSLISPEQARRNLEAEIAADDTVESVSERARALWADLLGRVEVDGATDDQLTTLYSCLYRLYLYPNSGYEITESGPRYASPVRPPAVVDGKVFVNNGFWDTYRTCWPAYALLTPTRCGELVDGFLQQYRDGGWVSRWSSPGYANLMTGTSSDVAFADAYLKGVPGFDVQDAYAAALRNATVTSPEESVGRKGLDQSIFLHYTPTATTEGLSWAMEGCVNDFGIALLAEALGDEDNHLYFLDRARHYAHLFDQRVGFFQGKDAAGRWRWQPKDYDPRVWGHDYTETNGWTAAFAVSHDAPGLAELYGGRDELAAKLDKYFATPETATLPGSYRRPIHEMLEARDVRMGQFGHSNQPAHHIPYLYTEAGVPARTQEKVRDVLARLYQGSEIGQGYLGDEDNGELSAWFLFSALGFYPLRVGSPFYAIGSPLFPRAVVHLENGRDLVVTAANQSRTNVYVQSLRVDGEPYDRTYIAHSVLAAGARLEFEMGPDPSDWGKSTPPPLGTGPTLRDLTRGKPGPLFDDTTRTESEVDTPVTVRTELAEVTLYTITSGSRGPDPSTWVLRGSIDGSRWHELDRREDEKFPWRKQTRPFKVKAPGPYRHYQLAIEGVVTVAQIQLLAQ